MWHSILVFPKKSKSTMIPFNQTTMLEIKARIAAFHSDQVWQSYLWDDDKEIGQKTCCTFRVVILIKPVEFLYSSRFRRLHRGCLSSLVELPRKTILDMRRLRSKADDLIETAQRNRRPLVSFVVARAVVMQPLPPNPPTPAPAWGVGGLCNSGSSGCKGD